MLTTPLILILGLPRDRLPPVRLLPDWNSWKQSELPELYKAPTHPGMNPYSSYMNNALIRLGSRCPGAAFKG